MNHRMLSIAVAVALAAAGTATALADGGKSTFTTNLTGYQETPVTLNSPGSGEFAAKISKDGRSIDYVLTYRDLPTSVLQSHIHFGRPALTGSIVLFLCTNLAPPANVPVPPSCPQAPVGGATATVTGTLTAANVISPTSTPQGLAGGDTGFAQIVAAIRNGAAYANVHTDQFKTGEIRGALGHPHDQADDDNDD
jgi:CHRD domain